VWWCGRSRPRWSTATRAPHDGQTARHVMVEAPDAWASSTTRSAGCPTIARETECEVRGFAYKRMATGGGMISTSAGTVQVSCPLVQVMRKRKMPPRSGLTRS
jgi:hypothetical protein